MDNARRRRSTGKNRYDRTGVRKASACGNTPTSAAEPLGRNFGGGRCLFEGSTDEATVLVLAYLSDDGLAIHITYSFPAGLGDAGRELAYYSFGTSLVN